MAKLVKFESTKDGTKKTETGFLDNIGNFLEKAGNFITDVADYSVLKDASDFIAGTGDFKRSAENSKTPEENLLKEEEVIFNEQCVLMEGLKDKFSKIASELEYENFTIVDGDPAQVNHYLTTRMGINELLQIKTEALSLLIPRIKLSKLSFPNGVGNKPVEQAINFKDHLSDSSIGSITSDKISRGDDVGIFNLSYELKSENIDYTNFLQCKLDLYFRNVNAFVKDVKEGASFKDLLINNKIDDVFQNVERRERISNAEGFKIKVEIGWADPQDPTGAVISNNLKKAIKKSRSILLLQLYKHDMNFNQDGSLTISATYNGSLEGSLKDKRSDLFALEEKEKTPVVAKNDPTKPLSKQQQDILEQEYSNAAFKDDIVKYSKILRVLLDKSRIFYVDVPKQFTTGASSNLSAYQKTNNTNTADLEKLAKEHPNLKELIGTTKDNAQANSRTIAAMQGSVRAEALAHATVVRITGEGRKSLIDKTNSAVSSVPGPIKKDVYNDKAIDSRNDKINSVISNNFVNIISPREPDKRRIYFFFLGDLIDAAFSVIKNRKDAYNIRALIGSIPIRDPRDPLVNKGYSYINIADIPISFNLFMSWYLKEYVAPRVSEALAYRFIKKILETLVIPAFGEDCFSASFTKNAQQHQINATNFSISAGDFFKQKKQRIDVSHLVSKFKPDIFSNETHHDVADIDDILFFYVSSKELILSNLSPNPTEEENVANGIYHLYPASDRGLVKEIRFSKIDIPYLDESRITPESSDVTRLRYRYNAKVVMFGNSFFRPGMFVFIDTSKFGLGSSIRRNKQTQKNDHNTVAQQLGIGGYYLITQVNTTIGRDGYETELECLWQFDHSDGESKKMKANNIRESVERKFLGTKADNTKLSEKLLGNK
jgi:hypothetical protein